MNFGDFMLLCRCVVSIPDPTVGLDRDTKKAWNDVPVYLQGGIAKRLFTKYTVHSHALSDIESPLSGSGYTTSMSVLSDCFLIRELKNWRFP
jgi:hypothetical protein